MTAKELFNQCGFPYYDGDTEKCGSVRHKLKVWGIS